MKRILNFTNISLFVVFLIYSVFIIYQSIYDENGFLTSDSAHYLQLAQNILNGDGLSTANYVEGMSTYFATWPVGYSLFIALIAFVSGLSVFWASKVVNILCLGFSFVLLKRLFHERAGAAIFAFTISTVTALFAYTWSEVPFLFGLLSLVFSLFRYIETEKKHYVVLMFLSAIFLFLMRYIGLIGGGIIGLIGFYYLFKKEWRQMFTLWITGSLVFVFAGLYLLINYINTGLATGMERIPPAESSTEFLIMLKESIMSELHLFSVQIGDSLLFPFVIVLGLLLLFIRPRHFRALFQIEKRLFLLPGLFLLVGFVYLVAIIYMRATAHFDALYFRLLGPATFMFILFLISWVIMLPKQYWRHWNILLTALLIVTLTFNLGFSLYETITKDKPTYKETVQTIEKQYEEVPQNSIVALENIHARYLRTDIQFIKVHFTPYFAEAEPVDDFLNRITPNSASGIYLQRKYLLNYGYDDSFIKLVEKAEKEKKLFIKLNH